MAATNTGMKTPRFEAAAAPRPTRGAANELTTVKQKINEPN